MTHSELMNGSSAPENQSTIGSASLWMVGISAALFFLPAVNGIVGGFVGGYRAGSPGRAIFAAILPAAIVAGLSWFLLSVLNAPVIGFFSGVALLVLILSSSIGLLAGAALGGAVSQRA